MHSVFKYIFILFFLLPLLGCEEVFRSTTTDPKAYPYELTIDVKRTLKRENERSDYTIHDINNDGESEIIKVDNILEPENHLHNVAIFSQDNKTIYQLNYKDTSMIGFIGGRDCFFDVDHDGVAEVFLWTKQNDSLFALVGNFEKNSWREIFLAAKPDTIPSLNWDSGVSGCWFLDVNNDGKKDLLCYLYTQLSKTPRGIFAYDIETGKRIWEYRFGAVPSGITKITDINGDDKEEILVSTEAPGNGATANGIDDYHSYIIAISKSGKLLWSTLMGKEGTHTAAEAFVNSDGKYLIAVIFIDKSPRRDSSFVAILDGSSGKILKTGCKTNEMFCIPPYGFIKKMNGTEFHFFLTTVNGVIQVLNPNLDVIQKVQLPAGTVLSDGLGIFDESMDKAMPFIGKIGMANNQTFFLDRDLDITMFIEKNVDEVWQIKNPKSEITQLAFRCDNEWCIANVQTNRYYLFFRYKYSLMLVALFVLGGGVWATRRFNFYYWLYVQLLRRSESEGIIVINSKNKIVHLNSPAKSIVAKEQTEMKRLPWQNVFDKPGLTDLKNFVQSSMELSDGGRNEIIITSDGDSRHIICTIAPIQNLFKRKLGWLLLFVDITKTIEQDRMLNWGCRCAEYRARDEKTSRYHSLEY
jgi:PAS domain S-box-containing protein